MAVSERANRVTTTVLSWVGGYVDTAGFLGLNGLFTAHVTGNLVVAGSEIAGAGGEAVWVRLAVIPVFIAAVALTTVLSRLRVGGAAHFLMLEAVLLLLFALVSVRLIPHGQHKVDPTTMFLSGAIGVFALGIQNGLMREKLGKLTPTTIMTGNLTQFTIDAAALLVLLVRPMAENAAAERQEARARLQRFGGTLLGFIAGAACGAYFMRAIGFWALLLPALAALLLALWMISRSE